MESDVGHTIPAPGAAEYLAAARVSLTYRDKLASLDGTIQNKPTDSEKGNVSMGLQKGKFVKNPNAPDDRFYFILITISLFSLVQMLPFLFFSTANEYWMYKFRNTTLDSKDANDRTTMQRYFSSLTTLTITTPGVICSFLAAIGGHKIKATTRVSCVLTVFSTVLVTQAIFVTINTDTCAMSLGGSGAMGLISKLPPIYMKAHLVGEGVAGVFSSLLRLLTIIISPSTSGAAFLYFGTGSALMIFTTIIFLFATKTKFFRYYTEGTKDEAKESLRNHKDIIDVLKIIWPLIILPLFGMLIPTTSIINLVVSQYNGTDNIWGDKYFVTICSYLVPALAGLFGRGLFNYLDIDLSVPLLYLFTITKDGLSGSLICLSNAKPRHNLTVIVNKDWEYALLTGAQAMSSGFFINLFMMKILRSVPPNRIELAMMITMFFLSLFSAITSPLGVLVVSLL
ncbi:hypothetical protein HUJ05_001638 [Dendroctonus ponderosae]|nr:hypothetical protein HUJ05_001638 [Dendroctonus ponderosae]